MPGSTLIAMIFFVAVLFAGMTSLINLYEAPIATVQEKLHIGRKPACLVIAVIGIVMSLLIQGIVSGWMDVLSIYICPLEQVLQELCFSGLRVKNMWKYRSIKEEKMHLQNYIFRYVNIFMCQFVF